MLGCCWWKRSITCWVRFCRASAPHQVNRRVTESLDRSVDPVEPTAQAENVNAAVVASSTARRATWNRRMWTVLSRGSPALERADIRQALVNRTASEVDPAVVGDRSSGVHRG